VPQAEKGVRGKGRQPFSPPQHTVTPERDSAPASKIVHILPITLQPLRALVSSDYCE
jgi:hypothetical protein